MKRTLPLVAVGNTPHGVIAIGNVARGFVAIGGSLSYGVIAIGTNAVGVVAIGLNAVGPVAVSAINAIGVIAIAGVNALGGAGRGFVNDGTFPGLGIALAVVGFSIGTFVVRDRAPAEVDPRPTVALAMLDTVAEGEVAVRANVRVDASALALDDGETTRTIALTGPPGADWAGERRLVHVRVTDAFDTDDGAGYRELAQRTRRLAILGVEAPPVRPWFAHPDDLAWAIGRGFQLASLGALGAAFVW